MNKMIGMVLIVVGFVSLVIGLIMYFSGKQNESQGEEKTSQPSQTSVSYNGNDTQNKDVESDDSNEKKGKEFEDYIVQKFNPKYFTIEEWRGDKGVNGIYPKSSMNPDLEITFKLGREKHIFAVECKYRTDLFKGGLEVADEDQLIRYRKFEKEKGIPVFMAIGYGNAASSPARLFVIPLSQVHDNFLKIDYLAKFEKHDIKKKFYYDYEEGKLR